MTSFRLLKIIFVLLLTITITEAGYYIFKLKKDNSTQVTAPSGPVATPSPVPLETRKTLPTGDIITPFIYEPDIWDALKKRQITEDHKVTIQIDNIGIVMDAIQNYSDSYNRTADLYLNVRYNKGVGPGMLFLNKNKIKTYIVSKDGQKQEASISDIKKGDKIVYKEFINIIDEQAKNYQYSYIIEVSK